MRRQKLLREIPCCLVLSLGWLVSPPCPGQTRVPIAELGEETHQIRSELEDVGLRLQRLAKKLESEQPDDAKRMIEAADRIHSSDLGRALDQIAGLLTKSNFVEAIGRQDRAIEELDAIIKILERTQYEGKEQDLERKAQEARDLARAAGELTRKQEGLLGKTRELLQRLEALKGLKDLSAELSRVQEAQKGLNQGKDPSELDPAGDRQDAAALGEAQAAVDKLAKAQKALNEKLTAAPGKDHPISELAALRDRMDRALAEGKEVARGLKRAAEGSSPSRSPKSGAETPKAAPGDPSPAPPPGPGPGEGKDAKPTPGDPEAQPRSGAEGAQETGEGKENPPGEGKKTPESPGTPGSEKTPGKESSPGAQDPGAKPSGEQAPPGERAPPGEQKHGGRGEDPRGGESPTKGGAGETNPGEQGKPEKTGEPSPGGQRTSPGDRGSQSPEQARDRAAELAKELGAIAGELAQKEGAPESARSDSQKAASGAQDAARDASRGAFEAAQPRAETALEDLKRARDAVAKQVAALEEKNTSEIGSLPQEQGMLQGKTSETATRVGESGKKASSQSSQSALTEGSGLLEEAAGAMEKAATSAQNGQRSEAKAAGELAGQKLDEARRRLEKAQAAVAQRTPAERAADLQKKLQKKAEEARKEAEALRKKLAKKNDPAAGAALQGAEGDLSRAAGAMDEAAQAQARGDQELAKKKGDEALSSLEKAQAGLSEEEKDQLARLEREKLKKNAAEQEQLARLGRDLAKKAGKSQESSEGSTSQENLEGASQSMEEAAEDLNREDAEGARKKQEEALARLKQSREELAQEEERLARLKREQEMTNLLASLEQFKEAEDKILQDTARIEGGREKNESRRQRLRIQQEVEKLAGRQGEVADQVDGLNQKLKEEYARVFTFVLRNASADMRQVRDALKGLDTGTYTQFLEKEIIGQLDRLVLALKEQLEKEQEQGEPPPGQGGAQQPGVPRLVPPVAELRMLKSMQLDVNKSTRDLEDVRKASGDAVTDAWKKALDRLLQRQGSVSRMTGALIKDFEAARKEAAGEGGAEGAEEPGEDHQE